MPTAFATLRRACLWSVLSCAFATAALPEITPAEALERAATIAPLPAVVAFAASHDLPLGQPIPSLPSGRSALPGDSLTALVSLVDQDATRQWLVQLEISVLSVEEEKAPLPPPLTLFTSTGNRVEFTGGRIALSLQTDGPFLANRPSTRPKRVRGRALVNAEYLALGFQRAMIAGLRLHSLSAPSDPSGHGRFGFADHPFPAEQIAAARATATALGLTPEEDRSMAGVGPALFAFFDVAQQTPGLREILGEILNQPKLAWSFVRHGGKLTPYFNISVQNAGPLNGAHWQLGDDAVHRFPFTLQLNQKPVLACALAVTAPRPPLLATAGIVGLSAASVESGGRQLTMRIVSAHLAAAP